MNMSNEILSSGRELNQTPYLRGLDFDEISVIRNPMLHVKLFHGHLCNMKCPYCFTKAPSMVDGIKRSGLIKQDDYRKEIISYKEKLDILRKIRNSYDTETVVINGKGEPTLEPGFDKLIKGLHSSGFTPVVFTNGITMAEKWKLLYENNASIVLKMNSIDPAKEAKLFGIEQNSNSFKQIRQALDPKSESFKAFAGENRLAINCIISSKTMSSDGAPAVLRFCRENGAIPWLNRVIITGRAGSVWNISDEEHIKTLKELLNIDRNYGYKHIVSQNMNFATPSHIDSFFLQITDHGRMFFSDGNGAVYNCPRVISHKCKKCTRKAYCINSNINEQLFDYHLSMLAHSMR